MMTTKEEYLAKDCKNCEREFNYLAHSSDVCISCEEGDGISWAELAQLTHATQVERFNWCMCEDNEGNENPYNDCPKEAE
jgi:hypothetical protein